MKRKLSVTGTFTNNGRNKELAVKVILQFMEFLLYARRFLSNVVAT